MRLASILAGIGLSSAALALEPLSDEQLADVTGQSGIAINIESRIQAQSIEYRQHNNDGSVRGSVSINNLDVFSPARNPDEEVALFSLEEAFADPARRVSALLGIDSDVVGTLQFLLDGLGRPGAFNNFNPVTGEAFRTETLTLDVVSDYEGRDGPTSALRITLPELSRVRNAAFDALAFLTPGERGLVLSVLSAGLTRINVAAGFDPTINGQSLGELRFSGVIDLDTRLYLYGRTEGASGLIIDADLGFGFEDIIYVDDDPDGGSVQLYKVRVGQVGERRQLTLEGGQTVSGAGSVLGARLLGLSLDVETRNLVDLTTGEAADSSVLVVGLPEIQNLDITVDDIRISDQSLGGLDIRDVNTLISNSDVAQLNQLFGLGLSLGTDSGVDHAGDATSGYQLRGEALISGTSENGLQLNAAWGGQIGSIEYHDGLDGVLGFNDISVYSTADDGQGNQVLRPFAFNGTLHLTEQGVELGNINTQGSIAIQSVTVGQSNLGALHIDNFQLRNSHVTISGRP